jgi:hypothetical protein
VRIRMRGQVVDVDARNQRAVTERIGRREQRGLGQGLGHRNARRRDAPKPRRPHEKQPDRPTHARKLRRPSDKKQADVLHRTLIPTPRLRQSAGFFVVGRVRLDVVIPESVRAGKGRPR